MGLRHIVSITANGLISPTRIFYCLHRYLGVCSLQVLRKKFILNQMCDSFLNEIFYMQRVCLYRAEKEKQQLKIELEQAKEQLENVAKSKV